MNGMVKISNGFIGFFSMCDTVVVVSLLRWFAFVGLLIFKICCIRNSLTSELFWWSLVYWRSKSILHEYNVEQFKAVGGENLRLGFMADNIGGFKINGTSSWADWLRQEEVPAPFWDTIWEFLIQQWHAGPYNNCGGAFKAIFAIASTVAAAGLSVGTANPYYVRFAPNEFPFLF
jgi:hypothetical protein